MEATQKKFTDADELVEIGSIPVVGQISRINPDEEEEAKRLVADSMNALGVEKMPTPCGYWICVKTYIRPDIVHTFKGPDGKAVPFYSATMMQAEDRYTSIAALVLAMGPDCYSDKVRFPQPWCKVGDWVIVPRNEGFPFVYGGVAMQMIYDDKIVCTIEDPALITSSFIKARV